MSKHLFGLVVTHQGIAANNRGETEGNITTLQKVLWNGEVYTTVSAEAIRYALRRVWQERGLPLNRKLDDDAGIHSWQDPDFKSGGEEYVDDDLLGFMSAKAAKEDGSDTGSEKGKKGRGTCSKRRSRLEITRALSLTPFGGDITFNAASPGATPSASRTGVDPVPYGTEVHATRYQYGFAMTPEHLYERKRAFDFLDAMAELGHVAGNHARFLFDFSPDAVILRWTDDFAPRMLYGFALENGVLSCPSVVERIKAGDIAAKELVVGGSLAATPSGVALKEEGAFVVPSVKEAVAEVKARMKKDLGI